MSSTATTSAPSRDRLDRGLLLVASVVVLGAVMSILDTTVVNVAIPTLARDFHTSLTTIQWIATGYTLSLATVIPLTGWGADRFGTKRLYLLSVVLFVLGSALSGLAWSAGSLIFFRVLQGLGGGMIMPAAMTILTRAAGPQRVGRVMAVIGVPMLIGPILGPILGGWLVDAVSWRWIFFINLPIGIAAVIMSLRVLPRDEPAPHHRLDWTGVAMLSPGLALAIYGFAQSSSHGGFGSEQVLVPMAAGLLLIGAFVWHALRTEAPLIDLRLFTNRTFAVAAGALILTIIAVFGGLLLMPLYLQAVRGETALQSGLLLAPQGFGAMLAMPIAGRLTDRTGVGRIVPVGLLLVGGSFLGLTQLGAHTSYVLTSVILFFQGLGMGCTMMPIMSGAMQTLRRAAIARASTTLNILQQSGASIGTAVLTVLLTHELAQRLPSAGGSGLGAATAMPPGVRERVAPLMADAFGHTFWFALIFLAVAFVASLALPKQRPEPVDDPDEPELSGTAAVPGVA